MLNNPSPEGLIGSTPLVKLSLPGLYAKVESRNLTGSVKDRAAKAMLDAAEKKGILQKGGTIIEATSGNTGIALSALAALRGYRCILFMPGSMSPERRALMAAYGAEVVLTDPAGGMTLAREEARRAADAIPGSFIPDQFSNSANPDAHYASTGPEILAQLGIVPDFFIAGVGSGGTITGVGRYLREKGSHVRIIAVEPESSPVLSGGTPGKHAIQGIGAGFVPPVLDRSVIHEVIGVSDSNASRGAAQLAREEGLLCGISSGAAYHAALQILEKNRGKTAVVLLPDTGERYLSVTP